MGADGDPRQPEPHRPREQQRAQDVPVTEIKHRAGQAFERLPKRDPGGEEKRDVQAVRRDEREHDEPGRAEE